MKKVLVFAFLALMLASIVSAQIELTTIKVERLIAQESVEPGKNIEIKININLNGAETSSIIVTEEIPQGWEVVSSNPKATKFSGKIKWLLYGDEVKDRTLKYSLKAPETFSGSQILNGGWKTLEEKGVTSGDIVIAESVPALQPEPGPGKKEGPPAQDYTMLIIGGVVGLIIIVIVVFALKKKKPAATAPQTN